MPEGVLIIRDQELRLLNPATGKIEGGFGGGYGR
jgi:hypothetical protein